MLDTLRKRLSDEKGLHADRAPRRDDHPRDPHRDRDSVLPQLPGPRERGAAAPDLRAAVPSIEAYAADNARRLRRHDRRRSCRRRTTRALNPSVIFVKSAAGTSYCVQATAPDDATKQAFKGGPLALIQAGGCP